MNVNETDKLGEKIRLKRKQMNINMVSLAKATGFSQGYISQVERGLIRPSIGALKKIAQALDVSISFFFDGQMALDEPPRETRVLENADVGNVSIVRANSRKGLIQPGSTVKYELLSPNLQGALEMLYIVGHPGGGSGEEFFVHNGFEGGVVVSGIMEYEVDGQKYVLHPGDSIQFSSALPHRWKNIGDEELCVFWVTTPPSF